MRIKILRQESPKTDPYWEEFEYKPNGKQFVSHILEELNYSDDLYNAEGKPSRKIHWDCICAQGMCGACAMVINDKPALACTELIDTDKTEVLKLTPLTKFPIISDLSVDRSIIFEQSKDAKLYLEENAVVNSKEQEIQYEVAKCIKCGLCLEICPNYIPGKDFYGLTMAHEAYLLYASATDSKNKIVKEYRKHFENFCSKSLSCQTICPMKISAITTIGKMNKA